jgi:alpha-galactosidase
MKIGKNAYAKGLGVHSVSELVFYLGGQFREFRSDIGVDSIAGGDGSVRFKVCVDGVVKCGDVVRTSIGRDSKVMVETSYGSTVWAMTGKDEPQSLRVDVRGAEEIRLVVDDAVNGQQSDFADWADARFVKADGSAVCLSDLPDERKLGLPRDWVTVELAEAKDRIPQKGVISLAGKLENTSTTIHLNYLADLGRELIRHRPVLVSWLRPVAKGGDRSP